MSCQQKKGGKKKPWKLFCMEMQVALPSSADFPPGSLSLLSLGKSSFKIGTCFQNCSDLEAKACRLANICSVLSIFGGQQNDPQMPESKWIIQALNFRVDAWFFKIGSPTTCQMLGMGWGRRKTAMYKMWNAKRKQRHLAEHQFQIFSSAKMGTHRPGSIVARGNMVQGKERSIHFSLEP